MAVSLAGPDPDGVCELTLAALAAQRYPSELVTVVPAAELAGAELQAAAQRHSVRLAAPGADDPAQAAAAAGELVVFLAAGAQPAPQCLAAHARWHETVSDAVTIGRSQRSDADDGEATALETFLEATRSLTERRADLFRAAATQNVAVRSTLLGALAEPRAADDPERWRLDLAYRLEQAGCVFVPESAAKSTHHYREPSFSEPERASDQRTQSLIPLAGFRSPGGGRLHERPALALALRAQPEEPAAEILETVDCLLAGRLSDLRLTLALADEHPARAELQAACAADPRVTFARPGEGACADAPYQVAWPALALADERTLSDLCELIEAEGVGALHVTVPG
ncbi:MAG: hypothetical protein H0U10_05540, partial [Chloroflexia bacterium]|nr:hypothetical protein [Chloroflexia bacterium]